MWSRLSFGKWKPWKKKVNLIFWRDQTWCVVELLALEWQVNGENKKKKILILWVVFNLWSSCFSYYLLLFLNSVYIYIMWKSMLSNILKNINKNILNNFLIVKSRHTSTHIFQKLPSLAPAPAPKSRNAPVLHRFWD